MQRSMSNTCTPLSSAAVSNAVIIFRFDETEKAIQVSDRSTAFNVLEGERLYSM